MGRKILSVTLWELPLQLSSTHLEALMDLRGQDVNLRPSGYEPDIFGCARDSQTKGTEKQQDFWCDQILLNFCLMVNKD